jgi:membrane-anchored protein YejM (alkaline phosphatase superfamily)
VINALAAILISLRFFELAPELPTDALGIMYLPLATFAHMTFLVLALGVVAFPVNFLPKVLLRPILAAAAGLMLVFIFIDTLVFAQYRFHINTVVLDLIFSGQVVDFPLVTWITVIFAILLVISVEWLLLYALNKKWSWIKTAKIPSVFIKFALLALLVVNLIHIWAYAHSYQSVTMVKRYLPYFQPIRANNFMHKIGWVNAEELSYQQSLTLKRKAAVHYPLSPLQTQAVAQPVNILYLVIDSWRYDTFSAENTPNLWALSEQGVRFSQHLSTGNSTRSGIFGLFYGMPATYFEVMLENRVGPVFIDRLQQLNYQIGVFASAHLRNPEFNQTVFVQVKNLREESKGDTPAQRDADLTKDWLAWHASLNKNQPSFSFLFYDAAHGYDFPSDYPTRFEPMLDVVDYLKLNKDTDPTPFKNRYKTSIHYVDSLIGQVLDALRISGDLENTLVVITGDHAQEINDNKQNYWGHGSNFSYAQVQVPFVLVGPDARNLAAQQAITDHQDLAPTIMEHYLGVTSPEREYSAGRNLFKTTTGRDWVIAGNFSGYALTGKKGILAVNAGGQYELLTPENRADTKNKLDAAQVQEAMEMMSRFNQ